MRFDVPFLLSLALSTSCATVLPSFLANDSSPTTVGEPSNETTPTTPTNGTLGGIFFCQDLNWINCTYTVQPLNTCIVMNEVWNEAISSMGPDNGTVVIAYNDTNCEGNGTAFVYPGSADLTTIGWNDIISSIKALAI